MYTKLLKWVYLLNGVFQQTKLKTVYADSLYRNIIISKKRPEHKKKKIII